MLVFLNFVVACYYSFIMTSNLDIYRSVQELIKQHGLKGASIFAADRIAKLLEQNDHEGACVWRKIRGALLDVSDIKFKDDPAMGGTLVEQEGTTSASDTSQNQTLSPDELARRAKNAEARKRRRAEYEANTTARKCLNCGEEFRSEGAHHRLCNRCK